jgi:hypothetical protein
LLTQRINVATPSQQRSICENYSTRSQTTNSETSRTHNRLELFF